MGGGNALMQLREPQSLGKSEPIPRRAARCQSSFSGGVANVNNGIGIVTDKIQASAAGPSICAASTWISAFGKRRWPGRRRTWAMRKPLRSRGRSQAQASASMPRAPSKAWRRCGAIAAGVAALVDCRRCLVVVLGKKKGAELLGQNAPERSVASAAGDPCEVARIGAKNSVMFL